MATLRLDGDFCLMHGSNISPLMRLAQKIFDISNLYADRQVITHCRFLLVLVTAIDILILNTFLQILGTIINNLQTICLIQLNKCCW